MSVKPVQCRCGQVVTVPAGPSTREVRCPSCGALVRGDGSGRLRPGGSSTQASPSHDGTSSGEEADREDAGGEYHLLPDSGIEARTGNRPTGSPAATTWVPLTSGPTPADDRAEKRPRRFGPPPISTDLLERGRKTVDLPGPFFKWSALVYPFVHPNWIRWIGLSFMTWLAVVMVVIALFVFSVIMNFGAYVSIFAVPTMTMGCLALVSYVLGCFVAVIEETAGGEDRLERLADMSWWEMLPRFMQSVGALAASAAVTLAVTFPLRGWFPWYAPELLIPQGILLFQLFPILFITNLVDGTWLPYLSLFATLRRLASCVGYFVAFLLVTALVTILVGLALSTLFQKHIVVGIAASGPIGAAWFMFYGHWLGRLARQLTAAE